MSHVGIILDLVWNGFENLSGIVLGHVSFKAGSRIRRLQDQRLGRSWALFRKIFKLS